MHAKLLEILAIDPGGIAAKCLLNGGHAVEEEDVEESVLADTDNIAGSSGGSSLKRTGSTDLAVVDGAELGRHA